MFGCLNQFYITFTDISALVAAEEPGELDKKMNATKILIYQQTDILLSNLFNIWPYFFHQKNSTIYRSANFFNAILLRHRASVKPGLYFWDEIQFYADIIENFLLWLNYEIDECLNSFHGTGHHYIVFFSHTPSSSLMTSALKSFSYLVNSLAYLGAEQSLCICFHSLICFSHKETFYYANLTFSAEVMFRTYIQSLKLFTEHKNDEIKNREYNILFPELSYCRQEILSGMDSVGVPIGPSVCNQSRRNETNIVEVNQLATKELTFFENLLYNILSNRVETTEFSFIISTLIFTFFSAYIIIMNLFRLIYFKTKKPKNKRKKKQLRFDSSSTETIQNDIASRPVQLTNLPHLPPPPPTRIDSNNPIQIFQPRQQSHSPHVFPNNPSHPSQFNTFSTSRNHLSTKHNHLSSPHNHLSSTQNHFSPDANHNVNFSALKVASV